MLEILYGWDNEKKKKKKENAGYFSLHLFSSGNYITGVSYCLGEELEVIVFNTRKLNAFPNMLLFSKTDESAH